MKSATEVQDGVASLDNPWWPVPFILLFNWPGLYSLEEYRAYTGGGQALSEGNQSGHLTRTSALKGASKW